jgi:probable rRNA maturation factor
MTARIEVQRLPGRRGMPAATRIRRWALAALGAAGRDDVEMVVRIVDRDEMSALNRRFRSRPGATNVLSFPFEDPPGVETSVLGDVVICADVVVDEARAQDKPLDAHFAHMVVHGVLHLCGHEHDLEADANAMESMETSLLCRFGFGNPYGADAGSPGP